MTTNEIPVARKVLCSNFACGSKKVPEQMIHQNGAYYCCRRCQREQAKRAAQGKHRA